MSGPLRPFFPYFGSKWSIAAKYQPPVHRRLVEPFAGSACYSLHHHRIDVVLVDAYEPVAGLWSFLIKASEREILSIPDIPQGERAQGRGWPQEWEWLAGFWCSKANVRPFYPNSNWGKRHQRSVMSGWGPGVRARIASQLDAIRHWRVIHGDYSDAPAGPASYFVDPPYQRQEGERRGARYPRQPSSFDRLGAWCRLQAGQVIVCEMEGASWLPFRPLCSVSDQRGKSKQEVVWTNQPDAQMRLAF